MASVNVYAGSRNVRLTPTTSGTWLCTRAASWRTSRSTSSPASIPNASAVAGIGSSGASCGHGRNTILTAPSSLVWNVL